MLVEIYYFSGTGNSYNVASNIASKLNAKLISIISLKNKELINSKADVIGIIFPIYDFKAPKIVNSLIKKLKTLDSTYFFAVCTYGVRPLGTIKKLNNQFKSVDKILSGGFCIKMPHNGLGYDKIPIVKQKKMFESSDEKCEEISEYVKLKKQNTIEKSGIVDYLVLIGILIKFLPKILKMLLRALIYGWKSLGFYFDKNCNSCGICEKICPMDNIEMIKNKPKWGENCISCFACIHWCPKNSIQVANLTQKMERYHHPDVKIVDIINQKKLS